VTTPTTQATLLGQLLKSNLSRNLSPALNSGDLAALVAGNSDFALGLYKALAASESSNLFYSPYSLSLALAMAYAGARGDTAKQMAGVLHFDLEQAKLHGAFNYLALELAKRAEVKDSQGKDGQGFRLNVVNDAWGQAGYPFLQSYLDTLAQNYGSGLRTVDFARAAEATRQAINDYISGQTEGRIPELIPAGAVNELTRLVLTNAIYFNAAWWSAFSDQLTRSGPFYLSDGSTVSVPMMKQTNYFNYASGQGYQAVELPYEGRQLSMILIMPQAGQFGAFEKGLNLQGLNGIISGLSAQEVVVAMPRFEFSADYDIGKVLQGMGMTLPFSGGADFSGMTAAEKLFISQVIHKSFISVDEAGTEAAAASAVIMAGAAPVTPPSITLDHPFIFLIRDIPTGTILFMGRVMNPQ
jgi:serpin B